MDFKEFTALALAECARAGARTPTRTQVTHVNSQIMNMETKDKVSQAVKLIKSVANVNNTFTAFSGGKDSVVLHFLLKEANVKPNLIHCVTTIDPPGTISFCQKMGAQLVRSDKSFLDLVEKKGLPTMFRRFCCEYLKEKYLGPKGFFGIRKIESVKRSKCYDDFAQIRHYKKDQYTEQFFPLLYMTDEDIETIVNEHSLEMHSLYYDNTGQFCVKRRLGCLGCPLQGDRGVRDYLEYPKLFRLVIKRLVQYHINHGRTAHDAYLNAVYQLFYSNHGHKKYKQTYEGLFPPDPKKVLEDVFSINL